MTGTPKPDNSDGVDELWKVLGALVVKLGGKVELTERELAEAPRVRAHTAHDSGFRRVLVVQAVPS